MIALKEKVISASLLLSNNTNLHKHYSHVPFSFRNIHVKPWYRSNPMLKVTHNGWAGGEVRNPRSVARDVSGVLVVCRWMWDVLPRSYWSVLRHRLRELTHWYVPIVMCLALPRSVLLGYLWLSPLKQVNNSRTRSVTLVCCLLDQPAIPRPTNYTLVKISSLVGEISISTPF